MLLSCYIMSNSLRPHGLYAARLLGPWHFPGTNTGLVAISFSRGSSQPRLNPRLLHWQADSLPLSFWGSSEEKESLAENEECVFD